MGAAEALADLHTATHQSLKLLFRHCAQLSGDQLHRGLEGFGYATVWEQLKHIVGVENYWLSTIQGIEPIETTSSNLVELDAEREQIAASTCSYIEKLGDSGLQSQFTRESQSAKPRSASRIRYIEHVITHAFHHKGQVVAMCRLLGHPAPDTDLIRDEPDV